MTIRQQLIILMYLLLISFNYANGYKILILLPFPGTSHWINFKHIIVGLLDKGHEVTAITNYALETDPNVPPYKHYHEVLIEPPFNIYKYVPQKQIFKNCEMGVIRKLISVWDLGLVTSEYAFDTMNVREFIKNDKIKFDLVISEQFFQESWLMFAHKFKSPIASISSFSYADYIDHSMGLLTPWSFVPHYYMELGENMTFFQRWKNVMVSMFDLIGRKIYYLPRQQKIANRVFGFLANENITLPSIKELDNRKTLVFVNNHISFDQPRPKMPGIIEIGGLNLEKKSKQHLPHDVKKFLDEAGNGVIYFSWGTVVKASELPKDKLRAFIHTFKSLKQRVLWKLELDNYPGLPSNVMIKKWMPQNNVLSHPNVVLFISHGGIYGMQESIFRGIPMLITPFYGDQHRNAFRAEQKGYASILKFNDLNELTFRQKLIEALENKKLHKRAKEISRIFRDNLNDPLDEIIYWIEYVCRHKGAKHLRSHARDLSVSQYLLWDVLGFLFIMFTILTVIGGLILRYIIIKQNNVLIVERAEDSAAIKKKLN